MNKSILIGMLALLVIVTSVNASEGGYVKYNTTEIFNNIAPCEDVYGLPCNSSISCNMSIFYENGTLWNLTSMSYFTLGFFNRTLGPIPFTGIHPVMINCTDGSKGMGTIDSSFEIKLITTPDPYPPVLNWSNPSVGGSNMFDSAFNLNLTANFTDPNGVVLSAYLEWDGMNQTAYNTTNLWYSSISAPTIGSHPFRWWMQDSNSTWSSSSFYVYNVYDEGGASYVFVEPERNYSFDEILAVSYKDSYEIGQNTPLKDAVSITSRVGEPVQVKIRNSLYPYEPVQIDPQDISLDALDSQMSFISFENKETGKNDYSFLVSAVYKNRTYSKMVNVTIVVSQLYGIAMIPRFLYDNFLVVVILGITVFLIVFILIIKRRKRVSDG